MFNYFNLFFRYRRQKGFSLVEIMIVISIIAILAYITFSGFSVAKRKAEAARVVSDLNYIEKALYAWGLDQGITRWWHEDVWGAPTDEPRISWLIDNTSFSNWLTGDPGINDANLYVYDNDDDTFDTNDDGCADGSIWNGVYINIWDESLLPLADTIDKLVDKSDGATCGKVVWDEGGVGGYFIGYRLANNYSDMKF